MQENTLDIKPYFNDMINRKDKSAMIINVIIHVMV